MRKIQVVRTAALALFVLAGPRGLVAQQTTAAHSATAAHATTAVLDPAGDYDFLASIGIRALVGSMTITRADDGGYAGELWIQGVPGPSSIEDVVVHGNAMDIVAYHGQIRLDVAIEFEGDVFAGSIAADGESLPIDGRRRRE